MGRSGNTIGNTIDKWGPPTEEQRTSLRNEYGIGWHARGGWCRKFRGDRSRTYFGWVAPAEAIREALREEDRRKRGEARAPAADLVLKQAANLFAAQIDDDLATGKISQVQRARYGQAISFLIANVPGGADTRLADFSAPDAPERIFRPLRAAAIRRGLSVGEKLIVQIRRLLDWCSRVRRLMPPAFFADAFDVPGEKEKRAAKKATRRKLGVAAWTPAEVREILAAAKASGVHRHAQVLLTLNGGLGATDLSLLEDSDVDWARSCVDTDRSKTLVPRVVPLWPETVEALKASRAERPAAADPAWDTRFFLTPHGRPLVTESLDESREKILRTDALKNWFYTVVNGDPRKRWKEKVPRLPHLKRHRGGYYTLRSVFATLAAGGDFDPNLDAIIMGQQLSRKMLEHYLRGDLLSKLRQVTDHVHAQLFA